METSTKKKIIGYSMLAGFIIIGASLPLDQSNKLKKPLLKTGYAVMIILIIAMLIGIIQYYFEDKKHTIKPTESDFLKVNCTPTCKSNEICIKGACVEKELKKPSYS